MAVTRAREKVIVISSINASDIKLSEAPPAGVLNLYHYLDYAARGADALALSSPQGMGEAESPLEEDVAGEIRGLGYDVIPQVGCSGFRIDIGVVDPAVPGRFLLGVECDGATYHSAATARDRDRLRQQVLEKLGWRIHRVWSPDWVTKRDSEVRRLKEAIEEVRAHPSIVVASEIKAYTSQEAEGEESPFERAEAIQAVTVEALPGTIQYKVHHLPYPSGIMWGFHDPQCREEQCGLLAALVREEGPIHFELAAKRLASRWGLQRTGSRVMSVFAGVAAMGLRRKLFLKVGDFLWPMDTKEVQVRLPVAYQPETLRDVQHIPPEELHAAMVLIVRHALGISLESLFVETARLFGFYRLGDRIRERLEQEYKKLRRANRLSELNGMVSLYEEH